MNRRRFLSCALVPFVPVAAAAPLWPGLDGAGSTSEYYKQLLNLGVFDSYAEMCTALNAVPLPWDRRLMKLYMEAHATKYEAQRSLAMLESIGK